MMKTPSSASAELTTRQERPRADQTTRVGPQQDVNLPERGSFLARYQVGEPLGVGGMGAVFRGWDPQLARPVALKIVSGSAEGTDEQQRLLREAQVMAQLRHPNVLPIYDAGTWQSRVFLAMELVEGMHLGQWTRTVHPTSRQLADKLQQAALGLHAAHSVGIVHCDFKPANVLIGQDGEVRLTDFGISRHASDAQSGEERRTLPPGPIGEHTASQVISGTPGFIAPEILAGQPATAAADQFAFGVTAYELFSREGKVAPGDRSLRKVPRAYRAVVRRTLASDPQSRFRSMADVASALAPSPPTSRRQWLVRIAAFMVLAPTFLVLGVFQLAKSGFEGTLTATRSRTYRVLNPLWYERRGDVELALAEGSPDERHRVGEWINAWCERHLDSRVSIAFEALAAPSTAPSLVARQANCLEDGLTLLSELIPKLEAGKLGSTAALEEVGRLPDPRRCIRMFYGPASDKSEPWPPGDAL